MTQKKMWWLVLAGAGIFLLGFIGVGVWRYQAWIPLALGMTRISISNPGQVPLQLAPPETIETFKALLPEEAKKRKVVLEFHSTMPENNQSYAFMKGSTWGQGGIGVACGDVEDEGDGGYIKKVNVYVTAEKFVARVGEDEAVKQISGVIRACLTQAFAQDLLSDEAFKQLSTKIYTELESYPLIDLD